MLFQHRHSTSCACRLPTRRGILAGGVGLLAVGAAARAQVQSPTDLPADLYAKLTPAEIKAVPTLNQVASRALIKAVKRIDVHHHPVPPAYVEAVSNRTGLASALSGWSPEKSLSDMDRANVETAMLSIPANGLWLPDAAANAKIARSCNEYMAGMVKDYPGRFGFWAALPLPDIDSSLKEVAYAFDTLHADGIGLFTVYGLKWLGDPAFRPLWEELNRRHAVVYTHPTSAGCCANLIKGVLDSVVEYGTDTARTIASLLFTGTAAKYPNVKLIFSHAGGTMPALIERFVLMSRQNSTREVMPDGIMKLVGSFYYDVAQAANPEALSALTRIVPDSQIVFGTDFPYRTSIEYVAALKACGFSHKELAAIGRTNALPLVPRLR